MARYRLIAPDASLSDDARTWTLRQNAACYSYAFRPIPLEVC